MFLAVGGKANLGDSFYRKRFFQSYSSRFFTWQSLCPAANQLFPNTWRRCESQPTAQEWKIYHLLYFPFIQVSFCFGPSFYQAHAVGSQSIPGLPFLQTWVFEGWGLAYSRGGGGQGVYVCWDVPRSCPLTLLPLCHKSSSQVPVLQKSPWGCLRPSLYAAIPRLAAKVSGGGWFNLEGPLDKPVRVCTREHASERKWFCGHPCPLALQALAAHLQGAGRGSGPDPHINHLPEGPP